MHKVGMTGRGLNIFSHKGVIENVLPYGFKLSGSREEFIYGISIDATNVDYKEGEVVEVRVTKKVTGFFIDKIRRF
tara:strand:- start:90 stop:317 length:228 start_codon:yes stop_codon:yes gene_type:complete